MQRSVCVAALVCVLGACGGGGDDIVTYGDTTVELDLAETGTRATETLIGNLVADAFFFALAEDGIDFAMVGGGGLRCPDEFDAIQCEGYIIPAGPIGSAQLEILLPFDNELVIKEVTGAQLRSTFERSVSTIPSERKGWFLHPSASLRYAADCALPAQTVNADGTVIETEGTRVTAITIDGVPIDDAATYRVATTAFVAAGNDGHVQLGQATSIVRTGVTERHAVAELLVDGSPLTPELDGRIQLTPACIAP